jgi:hypothetical protein
MSLCTGARGRRARVAWRSNVARGSSWQRHILGGQAEELALFSGEGDVCHFVDGAEEGHEGEGDVDDGDAAKEDRGPSCVWVH